jgi:zinc protease
MRSALASVLMLSACATPTARPGQPAEANPPAHATIVSDRTEGDVREALLSNGLKVLLREDHSAPVATFVVYYKVGSRNEHTGNTGSTHLLEHMQFKGSAHFPGREGIYGELTRLGANFNATTARDRTNFFETVPSDKLPFAIALEADRMRNSTFTDADRQSEMTVVRNELERGENDPARLQEQLMWATSIIAHPYHHPVIGWRSDVENVPTAQLRAFYDTYYQPDNAVAVAVGDFKSDEVLRLIVDAFGIYPGGHTFPPVYTTEPAQKGERRFVIRKPGEIGLVSVGWHLPPVDSMDVPALKALQLVLAGTLNVNEFGDPLDPGISNRLYRDLVETQLATGADMDYTLMIDENVGSITAQVRPEVSPQKVEDALRTEIRKLQTEPVTDVELKRVKNRARAAFARSQDGTFGQAMALGYFGLIADWRLARDFAARIDKVSAQDIERVARTYFTDKGLTVGWFVPESAAAAGAPVSLFGRQRGGHESYLPGDGSERVAQAVAAGGPSPQAPAAPAGSGSAPEIHKKTLPNGLRIIVQENHTNPTFALSGAIFAGSIQEKTDQIGLSSCTSDMIERGTKRHTKFELAAQLEDVGASFGFGGGFEQVSVGAGGLNEDLDRILDVMAEELLEPAFQPDELQKVIAEEIAGTQQGEDSTNVRARRALMQALYPKDHPLYIDDPKEVIRQLKTIDVARIRDFYRTFYGPDRTILTIVGDVDAQSVFQKIEARLGNWSRVGGPPPSAPVVPTRTESGRMVIQMEDKSNVDILMGEQQPLKRADAEYYPAMMSNYILGGDSGRLFRHVRNELGLTYGIGSSLSASLIAGPWTIGLSVNPQLIDKSLSAVHEVLDTWHSGGVKPEELDHAKTEIVGLFKVGLGSNGGLAGVLNQYEVLGLGAEWVKEHPKKIQAVTLESANAAIMKYFFPDHLMTVLSGTVPPAGQGAPAAGTR